MKLILSLFGKRYAVLFLKTKLTITKRKYKNPFGETWQTMIQKKQKLRPGIVRSTKEAFIIADTKYHDIKFNNNTLSNNPGLQDIAIL